MTPKPIYYIRRYNYRFRGLERTLSRDCALRVVMYNNQNLYKFIFSSSLEVSFALVFILIYDANTYFFSKILVKNRLSNVIFSVSITELHKTL